MCTGVSIEQWRVAVGVMAAMAPNCKRRCKKSKATGRSFVFGKLLTVLVLLMLLMSNHTDSEPGKAHHESVVQTLPPLAGMKTDKKCKNKAEQRIQVSSEPLVSVSGLLPVLCFLMVLVQKLLLMCGDVEPNPGPTPLTIDDLEVVMKELSSVEDKWLEIGRAFNFREETLRDIESKCSSSYECLRSIIRQWLQVQAPVPTWEEIVDIVSLIGEEELAERMRHNVPGKEYAFYLWL